MVNRDIGYSLWLDFIERDFLKTQFAELVEKGIINGATSNPAIFSNAIISSPAYKEQLSLLKDKTPKEKYEALAIEDIKLAAQLLRPLYDQGNDGFISLEVDPFLCNDTKATISEAKRLFKAIGEPNVMIKIPATKAGFSAMRQLLATGISVNATLVFSLSQARKCLKAMKKGLALFENSGGIRAEGVISIFVSRFDRELDDKLKVLGITGTKTGIYNAARIYRVIEKEKVPNVRALFASTGVKEPSDLPKDYYIRELYGRHCINTAPLATILEYIKTPQDSETLPLGIKITKPYFQKLEANGIDMHSVYDKLLEEGLMAFEDSFTKMLDSLK
ncbi:MAG: transaldolase [Sulfurovum sp. AS07-7]|nr:MAG: transaldolase [Sulfurovum sp. AS07-7]